MDKLGNMSWLSLEGYDFESKKNKFDVVYSLAADGTVDWQNGLRIDDTSILDQLSRKREDYNGNYAITDSFEIGDLFLFASDHSIVEWELNGYQTDGMNTYTLRTSHEIGTVALKDFSAHGLTRNNWTLSIHSHPGELQNDSKMWWDGTPGGSSGDRRRASQNPLTSFYVYQSRTQTLFQYTSLYESISSRKIINNRGLRFLIPKK